MATRRNTRSRRPARKTKHWEVPRLNERKLQERLNELQPNPPNALEELVEEGCRREMLIYAVHAVVVVESIPANQRRAFTDLGFSEKTIQARVKRFSEDANFLRGLARKHFVSLLLDIPAPLLTELPEMLDALAERLALRPPSSPYLRQLRETPIAALKHYVSVHTGRRHYQQIADLIAAARYACGRDTDEVDSVDVIRKRGEDVPVEDAENLLNMYVRELNVAWVHLKTIASKR